MLENSFLLTSILRVLRDSGESVSEYELIDQFKPYLEDIIDQKLPSSLKLFKYHFLVMNALYQLQQEMAKENLYLYVSALEIYMLPMKEAADQALVNDGAEAELRNYYLDGNNFVKTDSDDVDSLLQSFWQRYLTEDKKTEAYQQLELDVSASLSDVQTAYRRLVGIHHPDKGGSNDMFMVIREAYEVLTRS